MPPLSWSHTPSIRLSCLLFVVPNLPERRVWRSRVRFHLAFHSVEPRFVILFPPKRRVKRFLQTGMAHAVAAAVRLAFTAIRQQST